jgi:Flp pilus assembly protein TadG
MRIYAGNRRGQTVVLFAFALIPLLGMMGLVVDVGWAYFRKQAAQPAADAAASAAAVAAYTSAGGKPNCGSPGVACYSSQYTCPATLSATPANNILAGCLYAKANGFETAGRQKVTFQSGVGSAPTATGVTISYWVVARVSERVPRFFLGVLGATETTIVARATTGTREADGGGCVLTLNPTATGISMNGATSLSSGCGVYVNSNSSQAIRIVGNGDITTTGTAKTQIVGSCSGCSNIHPAAQTGVPVTADPFSSLAAPYASSCQALVDLKNKQKRTLAAGCYNGINLGGQSELTLDPGVYVIRGGLNMQGGTVLRGTGVMLYIETGVVDMNGGATVDLTAPTSGTYQGILMFQARTNTGQSRLTGGATQLMNGALYFPAANLRYTGGSGVNATQTTIVADTLELVGNSYIQASAITQFTGVTGGAFIVE